MAYAYGPVDPTQLSALIEIQQLSFLIGPGALEAGFDALGHEHLRVVSDNGRVVGGLALLPLGQYFGGRSVPMTGIAAVAIAPEDRGTRAAAILMTETVRELHAKGVAISTLYPATFGTYRRAGYELAGVSCHAEIPCRAIRGGDADARMRALDDADKDIVRPVYDDWVRSHNGPIDRSDMFWWRLQHELGQEQRRAYGVFVDEQLTGYVYCQPRPGSGHHQNIVVSDIVAADAAAVRRLLGFFARERYQRHLLQWRCGPADPFVLALQDVGCHVWNEGWMTRIVDVPAALSSRGYPSGLNAELLLDVADDVVPENEGAWRLTVSDGRGVVERAAGGEGNTPRVTVDIRGLAQLYTGFAAPATLRRTGHLQGDDVACGAAAGIFGGSLPWMSDAF
jgi:predicted acetyltransferase